MRGDPEKSRWVAYAVCSTYAVHIAPGCKRTPQNVAFQRTPTSYDEVL